jgi:hypothetical protein
LRATHNPFMSSPITIALFAIFLSLTANAPLFGVSGVSTAEPFWPDSEVAGRGVRAHAVAAESSPSAALRVPMRQSWTRGTSADQSGTATPPQGRRARSGRGADTTYRAVCIRFLLFEALGLRRNRSVELRREPSESHVGARWHSSVRNELFQNGSSRSVSDSGSARTARMAFPSPTVARESTFPVRHAILCSVFVI